LAKQSRTDFDVARDELMSHIHRCGVLQAAHDQQVIWLEDTMQYLGERYPGLSKEQLGQLHQIGLRFCQPVIFNGSRTDDTPSEDLGQGEMVGAA
jgi:hypothetical protein